MSTATIADKRRTGLLRLAGICLMTAAIWLIVLPWVADFPPVARWLQWLDDHQVDPSAMYYTEVEAMRPTLERLNAPIRRNAKTAFSSRSDD